MINYINNDITTVEEGVLAHGVNCQGVMGSGVAKAIRKKWPYVYSAYVAQPTGANMLGLTQIVTIKPNKLYVANCYTQVFYGKNGKFATTEAIDDSLHTAYTYADLYHLPLYMPQIGAGLGGLDWENDVEPIVNKADKLWSRVDTYVCIWNP